MARVLCETLEPPPAARRAARRRRPGGGPGTGRPTKRERRAIEHLHGERGRLAERGEGRLLAERREWPTLACRGAMRY